MVLGESEEGHDRDKALPRPDLDQDRNKPLERQVTHSRLVDLHSDK